MNPKKFFFTPQNTVHKQYEALRSFFLEGKSAEDVAAQFGYKTSSFYSLSRDFRKRLNEEDPADNFFQSRLAGRQPKDKSGEIDELILKLRKRYLSVSDIKAVLDVQEYKVSEAYIYQVIKKDGFSRLPRRSKLIKQSDGIIKIEAPKSVMIDFSRDSFSGQNSLGVLCLIPYLQKYGIDRLIENSAYPETQAINKLSSILAFVGLKLSNVRRYTADDLWCMDRGLGLFAGLNVLPKTSWFSSYSHRVTSGMNREFLKDLMSIYLREGLLSDTINIDFTTIPYWGDSSHLENNWAGTRGKALPSILAVLAQDPDSGIITYGDTTIRHDKKSDIAVEFLDFYPSDAKKDLKYLVFDSQFTTYGNLAKLGKNVKFVTIRRRGKKIVEELEAKPASAWKKVRVTMAGGKGRWLKILDESIFLKDFGGELRQVAITGHGKIKPALIITNDFEINKEDLVRKYCRRWIVEKCISEQIEFFHLNRVSSSMVIKVDFDLTMTILAHNILRLFTKDLPGFEHKADATIYEAFLSMNGDVEIKKEVVIVKLKKKRNLPTVLTALEFCHKMKINMFGKRELDFQGASTS